MKEIRTITLNPCFDLHYSVPDFAFEKENLATGVLVEAGGKGVNTSRALTVCGVENLAYLVVGDENGEAFLAEMKKEGIPFRFFTVKGRIRENMTIHSGSGKETRISINNFRVTGEALAELEQVILAEHLPNLLISFSGRIPQGITKEEIKRMLKKLIDGGAKLVIDSASFTPDDLKELHPWFVKPNEQEIDGFLGRTPKTLREAAADAKELVKSGVSETVMISLGGEGAAFADRENAYLLQVPKLEHPLSTIGAGDSTIAGLLAGTAKGLSKEETLRLAVAYGTAACMTAGTLPPRPEDVEEVFDKTRAERV